MRSDRVRELRLLRGFSQEFLAREIEVGNLQVWRYENGENVPSAEILAKIALALNASADYLLGLTDDPTPQANSELSPREQSVIAAWRRGDLVDAIRGIVGE